MLRDRFGYEKCRWSYIRQNPSFPVTERYRLPVAPHIGEPRRPAQNGDTTLSRISGRLSDAYFVLDVNKDETLKRAVSLIDDLFRQLDTRSANSDIMGDIFEYLARGGEGVRQKRSISHPAPSSSASWCSSLTRS